MLDICGVCNGPGIVDGYCDCHMSTFDCVGTCGGDYVYDECDVCGGMGIPTGTCDCSG